MVLEYIALAECLVFGVVICSHIFQSCYGATNGEYHMNETLMAEVLDSYKVESQAYSSFSLATTPQFPSLSNRLRQRPW